MLFARVSGVKPDRRSLDGEAAGHSGGAHAADYVGTNGDVGQPHCRRLRVRGEAGDIRQSASRDQAGSTCAAHTAERIAAERGVGQCHRGPIAYAAANRAAHPDAATDGVPADRGAAQRQGPAVGDAAAGDGYVYGARFADPADGVPADRGVADRQRTMVGDATAIDHGAAPDCVAADDRITQRYRAKVVEEATGDDGGLRTAGALSVLDRETVNRRQPPLRSQTGKGRRDHKDGAVVAAVENRRSRAAALDRHAGGLGDRRQVELPRLRT